MLLAIEAKAIALAVHLRRRMSYYMAALIMFSSEIRAQWGEIIKFLPQWPWVVYVEHHVFTFFGVVVVYAEIRRSIAHARAAVVPEENTPP